ncbi:MAG: efflux RND transporter periplasmic adaptor subunit [Rhodothalassiaceae bacterium]
MTSPNPSWPRLAVPVVILALVGLGYMLWPRGGDEHRPAEDEPALPVSVLKVALSDHYVVARGFTGRVTARRRADLGFERDGRIAEMLVDDGAQVRKGEKLAILDKARLLAERREADASIAEAEANLARAERAFERTRTLFEQGHVSEQRLDDDRAATDAARATLDRFKATRDRIDVELTKSVLLAPFDGVIERRLADEGAVIATGTPVLQIVESGRLEAEVGMPLSFANTLEPGAHLPLRTGTGEVLFAEVTAVVPVVRGETRTALVTLALSGEVSREIADGSIVSAEINDRIAASGFWIPIRALTADVRGLWRVYKVMRAPDGVERVVFENVQLLHSEKDRAYVSGTVNEGDLLIDGGVARVVPGRRVEVVRINTLVAATSEGA